jgi:sugar phosphate isomerase/epimerase
MRWAATSLLPADPNAVTVELAREIRRQGFSGTSWHLADPDAWTVAAMRAMVERLAEGGVALAQLLPPQYPSLVVPDAAARRRGIEAYTRIIGIARQVGADNLYLRPTSMAPGSWSTHRDNHLPETRDRLVESLRAITAAAESEGVILAMEGHVVSPLDTPEHTREVFDAVASPALRFNMDPVNYIPTVVDAYRSTGLLERLFSLMGQFAVAAHAKDVTVEDRHVVHLSEVAPGRGYLDHHTFLRRFEAHCPDGYFIIEHLPAELVPEARAHLGKVAAELGIVDKG